METRYGLGMRVPKTKENVHGWKDIDIFSLDLSKAKNHVVLYFGGGTTISSKEANGGGSRYLEKMLAPHKADIYSFYYPSKDGEADTSQDEMNEIMEQLFSPLVLDTKGNLLPKEQIKQNLGNITFVSYCYGNSVVENIWDKLRYKLLYKGMSNKDIIDTCATLTNIAYSPYTKLQHEQNLGQSVNFFSFNDKSIRPLSKWFNQTTEPNLGAGKIVTLQPNKIAYVVNSVLDIRRSSDDHPFTLIAPNDARGEKDLNIPIDERAKLVGQLFTQCILENMQGQFDLQKVYEDMQQIITKAQNTEFEKEQYALLEDKLNGVVLESVLDKRGVNLQGIFNNRYSIDILNRKNDEKLPEKINYSTCPKLEEYVDYVPNTTWAKKVGTALAFHRPSIPYEKKVLIFGDGKYYWKGSALTQNSIDLKKEYVCARLRNLDFSNAIEVEACMPYVGERKYNYISIKPAKVFEEKNYKTLEELESGIVEGIQDNPQLTAEQTRVICNLAINMNVVDTNIKTNNYSLDQNIWNNEIKIDKNGQIGVNYQANTESAMDKGSK